NVPSGLLTRTMHTEPADSAEPSIVIPWVQFAPVQLGVAAVTAGAVSIVPAASTQSSATASAASKFFPASVTFCPVAPTIDAGVAPVIDGGAADVSAYPAASRPTDPSGSMTI